MPNKGLLTVTYYSGEGRELHGCKPYVSFRKALLSLVLLSEEELVGEEFRSRPRDHKRLLPGEKCFKKHIGEYLLTHLHPTKVITRSSPVFRCLGELPHPAAARQEEVTTAVTRVRAVCLYYLCVYTSFQLAACFFFGFLCLLWFAFVLLFLCVGDGSVMFCSLLSCCLFVCVLRISASRFLFMFTLLIFVVHLVPFHRIVAPAAGSSQFHRLFVNCASQKIVFLLVKVAFLPQRSRIFGVSTNSSLRCLLGCRGVSLLSLLPAPVSSLQSDQISFDMRSA